jgi:thiol-disulfide isomerase/thioredoxin
VRFRSTLLAAMAAAALASVGPLAAESPRFVPWSTIDTPALALSDLGGRLHALADYHGQVLLINFWATWCEPCREEMASMQRLRERMSGQPVTLLTVNYGESRQKIGEFVRRLAFDLPVLLDPGQQAARAWKVRVLPTSFLVGPDGRARYTVVGELDWAGDEAVSAVRGLLR